MTPTQARKKRAKLNVKIKAGKATTAEKAEFARLQAMKVKPGRPRKVTPKESPPDSSTVSAPTTASPLPSIPDVPVLEGAAPGLDFGVPGFASITDEEAAKPAPAPDVPIVPTDAALQMADKVVGGLAYLGAHMTALWGFDPLMGAGPLVYPALRHAWAQVIEESGMASKAEALMNNRTAARVAVVSSSVYLGGGGLFAMMELRKREKLAGVAQVVPADAPSSPPAPGSAPPPSEPLADAFAQTAKHEPPPIVAKPVPLTSVPSGANGIAQMPISFGGAEDKS